MTEAMTIDDLQEALSRTAQEWEDRADYLIRMGGLCKTLTALHAALPSQSPVRQAAKALLEAITNNPYDLLDLSDFPTIR
jgi:hypothetical protein